MTRLLHVFTILFSLSTAACGGDSNATGGASNKGTAGTKDGKAAGGASGGAAVGPGGAAADSFEGCLKSCDGSNESATDKATCRLNCDAAFGGDKKNAEPDGPR